MHFFPKCLVVSVQIAWHMTVGAVAIVHDVGKYIVKLFIITDQTPIPCAGEIIRCEKCTIHLIIRHKSRGRSELCMYFTSDHRVKMEFLIFWQFVKHIVKLSISLFEQKI